jgi:hypothetical protein
MVPMRPNSSQVGHFPTLNMDHAHKQTLSHSQTGLLRIFPTLNLDAISTGSISHSQLGHHLNWEYLPLSIGMPSQLGTSGRQCRPTPCFSEIDSQRWSKNKVTNVRFYNLCISFNNKYQFVLYFWIKILFRLKG